MPVQLSCEIQTPSLDINRIDAFYMCNIVILSELVPTILVKRELSCHKTAPTYTLGQL